MASTNVFSDWNNVTSPGRNDIVFQDKNKEYGAYRIRKNYNKNLILITGICCLVFLLGMSVPKIISLLFHETEEVIVPVDFDPNALPVEPPPVDEKEPPPPPPPPPPVQNTVKFVPPVVKDEAIEEEPPPIQETETKISTETVKGEDDAVIEMPVETIVEPVKEEPFIVVEEMPEFPGGEAERQKFFHKHFNFPIAEKENHIGGTVYVGFIVDKEGNISDVQLLRGVKGGPGLDKEALRVVKMMPKWKPGKNGGRAVPVRFNLPIKCDLR